MTVLQKLLDTSAPSRENGRELESSQLKQTSYHSYFVAAPRGLKGPGLDVRWEGGTQDKPDLLVQTHNLSGAQVHIRTD